MSQKNDDIEHYNFDAHQPILTIFGKNVAARVNQQMTICFLASPAHLANVRTLPGKTRKQRKLHLSNAVLMVYRSSDSYCMISSILLTFQLILMMLYDLVSLVT